MDIVAFHLKLLGAKPSITPEAFHLTKPLRDLYTGFGDGLRGFDSATEEAEHFLGAFVMALAQTEAIYPVYLVLPRPKMKWAFDQIEVISRHIFRTRKGQRDGVKAIRTALRQIRASHQIVTGPEPDRWAMFGFASADPLFPAWAQGRLLNV